MVVLCALAAQTLAACSSGGSTRSTVTPSAEVSPNPDAFVTAQGRDFVAGGQAFRFVGANIYDAAASDLYSCNPGTRLSDAQLDDTLRQLHEQAGATVLRFWAYQTYTRSGQDFSGVDRVITAARANGMRVIPVLEDGPGDCTSAADAKPKIEFEGDTWYTSGYQQTSSGSLSFRDYARQIADHYRDEPTILGWSLVNEAETNARTSDGTSVLVPFSEDVAAVVHSADPNHLVTLGTQSNGAPGASGPDFTAVYSVPQLDFAEVHDWGYWGSDTEAMPGGTDGVPPAADSSACALEDAKIGCSFARAAQLGKPLFVGEAGIQADDASSRDRRADLLAAKVSAAFAAGAAGYLVWSVTTRTTDGYDVVLADDDPLLGELARAAAANR